MFLDLAFEVLKNADKPLTYPEIWQAAQDMGLARKLGSVGKTTWQSLASQLYVDVRDNDVSRFIKVGKRPARFFLKERSTEITEAITAKIEKAEEKPPKKTDGYRVQSPQHREFARKRTVPAA